jgi:hypothetical protein
MQPISPILKNDFKELYMCRVTQADCSAFVP